MQQLSLLSCPALQQEVSEGHCHQEGTYLFLMSPCAATRNEIEVGQSTFSFCAGFQCHLHNPGAVQRTCSTLAVLL